MKQHDDNDLYWAVSWFLSKHGYSPSRRDLVRLSEHKSTSTVHATLLRLREAGRIAFVDGISRSITLVREEVK